MCSNKSADIAVLQVRLAERLEEGWSMDGTWEEDASPGGTTWIKSDVMLFADNNGPVLQVIVGHDNEWGVVAELYDLDRAAALAKLLALSPVHSNAWVLMAKGYDGPPETEKVVAWFERRWSGTDHALLVMIAEVFSVAYNDGIVPE